MAANQGIFCLTLVVLSLASGCGTPVGDLLSGKKVTRVQVKAGDVIITDDEDGMSHVKIECNSGLVIDADWKRNSANDFGYDIYEPEVSETYNRLAVMMMARGVIAGYLRGEYE